MAKQEIKYYWGDDHLLINLGSRVNARMRALYVFELLFTVGLATVILFMSLPVSHHLFLWVNVTGAALLYFLAARRFILRIYLRESIVLDNQYIAFTKQTMLSKKVRRYDWRLLGSLHYEGHPKKTDHPLKGRSFDYLGFETHEQIVQVLHRNGNLYFDTPEGRLYFALGVYSWHAEEMVQMMKMYMGNYLHLGPEWEQMLQAHEMDDAQ